MKHCNKCDRDLALTDFHRSAHKSDGYMTTCKDCKRQSDKQWRDRRRDKIREQSAAWAKANRARKGAVARIRELSVSAPVYVVSDRDLRRLKSSPCIVQGCDSTDMTIDHLVPLSRGGSHGVGNLAPMCRRHNSSKLQRTWMEYRVYLTAKRAKPAL